MATLSQREREMEAELEELARRHPLYPRAWEDEVRRRLMNPGWDLEDAVLALREVRNLIPSEPVTIAASLDCERRYLALVEPDELLPESESAEVPARSSAD